MQDERLRMLVDDFAAAGTCGMKARLAMLADGMDNGMIQLMLGHSDITMMRRYLNITFADLCAGGTQLSNRSER